MTRSQAKDPTRRLIPLGNPRAAELPIGSWLVAPRCGYTHHGIYVGAGQVVHYSGLSRRWKRGPVEIVSLAEFSLEWSVRAKWTPTARYVGLQAAERALSRLGEDNYHIMTNNCEHFCAWCLDGASRSRQVELWLAWPRATALAIVAWLVEVLTEVDPLRAKKRSPSWLAALSPDHRTA